MDSSNHSSKAPSTGNRGFWTPARIVLTLAVVGLLAALGLSSCNSSEVPSNATANRVATASPPKNTLPPAFVPLPQQIRDLKLQTLEGESLKLSDYADKVVVVNIWATWCGPCRTEMPDLVKLSHEYKERGLVVLGLATTYNEHNDPTHVKDFVRSQNVDYKIIWDDGTLAAPLVRMVNGPNAIPQSFVISRDGRIVKHFPGFSPYSTPTLMRQAVEDALNDKGKA
ncbi:MAG TPA: TlpA disulfide reductase family protein [Pyrinomonadaceae bacterium]|nr:TlpA disulfide reductase family protein [Pyrinomonadaceae bacterium]